MSYVRAQVAAPFAYKTWTGRLALFDVAADPAQVLYEQLELLRQRLGDDPEMYLDVDADPTGMVVMLVLIQPLRPDAGS